MPVQPPNFLGSQFWAAENRRLVAIMRPLLQEAAELGVGIAEEDLMQFEVGFDNALANAEAADWARRHTDELLMQLGTTTQKQVHSVIANWFTTPGGLVGEFIEVPGMTLGDLSTALERVLGYNRSRAQMIARTEATRATAEGREVSRVAAGLPPTLYKPPAHPRGRCWDSEDLLADGTWVTIWQTRRDEVVCQTPLETPLGEMQGCRDLHGRVISEGPYFGMPIEDARAIAAARAEGQERVTAEQAAAELAGALAEYEAWQAGGRSVPVKFDPAQPRDETGRWTTTGVSGRAGGGGIGQMEAQELIDRLADRFGMPSINVVGSELGRAPASLSGDEIRINPTLLNDQGQFTSEHYDALPQNAREILLHEYGHVIHQALMFDQELARYGMSGSAAMRQAAGISWNESLARRIEGIAKIHGSALSDYATTHGGEYMAEAFVAYIKGGKYRGAIHPDVLEIFKDLEKRSQ